MTSSLGRSLFDLFSSSKQRQEELQSLDPRGDTYKDILNEAIKDLEECEVLLAQNGIFSPNEELDDISTHDLQLLSVEFLLADLILKAYGDDRAKTLRRASELYDSFLTRLDQYNILSSTDRKLFERFQENKTAFTLMSDTNAEERRKIKISRFQEERSLKSKLEYLRNQSATNPADDETLRKLYLAEISLHSSQAFQSLDMITQEAKILSQARLEERVHSTDADERQRRNGLNADGYSERLDGPLTRVAGSGPLLDQQGKPLRPFTLTDNRIRLQQGVFQPSHNLPTMSIDEYLEEEKRRGGILDSSSNNNAQTVDFDEDDIAHVDAETMKARDWDDFVEAHPKGAGNTLNRG